MKKQETRRDESTKKHSPECLKAIQNWQPLVLHRNWQTIAGDLDEVLNHSEQYLVCPVCGERLS